MLWQRVYEFRVALLVGCTLVAADTVDLDISFEREVHYREGDNTVRVINVDLLFPATERSIMTNILMTNIP